MWLEVVPPSLIGICNVVVLTYHLSNKTIAYSSLKAAPLEWCWFVTLGIFSLFALLEICHHFRDQVFMTPNVQGWNLRMHSNMNMHQHKCISHKDFTFSQTLHKKETIFKKTCVCKSMHFTVAKRLLVVGEEEKLLLNLPYVLWPTGNFL